MKRLFFWILITMTVMMAHGALSEGTDTLRITELMAQNGVYIEGEAYDWLEIFNPSDRVVDLSGYGLSDNDKKPFKWVFPDGARVPARGYVVVYLTGEDMTKTEKTTYYANFKLSSDGETALLTAPDGLPLSRVEFPAQYGCVSYGEPSGGGENCFLLEATPGAANTSGAGYRLDMPQLNPAGGFFDASVAVTAIAHDGAQVRYTLDGSEPTASSPLFPNTLTLDETAIVRIRAFAPDAVPSQDTAATYFIGARRDVPVVSLIGDDRYLFDPKTGSLVTGSNRYPNYEYPWEYPIHIEYFDETGAALIRQTGTFTMTGHSALQNAQRSISIFARNEYGSETFAFNPMPNRGYQSYKSLLLRAANSDARFTRLRDPFISSLAEGMDLLYQDALPIVVYINCRYWGHYNLREKINKYFVAQWEGVTDPELIDQIDILRRTGEDEYVQNGSNADWLFLMDYCRTHDLKDPDCFAYVDARLDIQSLYTHTLFEMIVGNSDMNNVRVYRVPGGKWKYLLFDVEAGMMNTDATPIELYIRPLTRKAGLFQHAPLVALLAVPEQREAFLARASQMVSEYFLWPRVSEKLETWVGAIDALLDEHITRWRTPKRSDWIKNINAVRYYARVRPKAFIRNLCSALSVSRADQERIFGETLALLEQYNAAP